MTQRNYIIPIGNKEYKLVAGRVIDFRQSHPNGAIISELMVADADRILFKASIIDSNGTVLSTAHAEISRSVRLQGQVTHFEKCETKAIGRALGLAGFGTDDINDDEDGEQIADSPLPPKASKKDAPVTTPAPAKKGNSSQDGLLDFAPVRYEDTSAKNGNPFTMFFNADDRKIAVFDTKIASELKAQTLSRVIIKYAMDGNTAKFKGYELLPF